MDRQSGRGRGTRNPDEKKGGAGRGNWGAKPDQAHKQGRDVEAAADGETPETEKKPVRVEEEKQPEPETEEVILGVGLDDFLQGRVTRDKAQARKAEGIKGAKVEAVTTGKTEKVA